MPRRWASMGAVVEGRPSSTRRSSRGLWACPRGTRASTTKPPPMPWRRGRATAGGNGSSDPHLPGGMTRSERRRRGLSAWLETVGASRGRPRSARRSARSLYPEISQIRSPTPREIPWVLRTERSTRSQETDIGGRYGCVEEMNVPYGHARETPGQSTAHLVR